MPRDAEAWLAERGIERDPIRVPLEPPSVDQVIEQTGGPVEEPPDEQDEAPVADDPLGATSESASVSSREAQRLTGQASADAALLDDERRSQADPSQPRLEDDVAKAVAFIRRSTAVAPQSEQRVRTKLADRDWPSVVIEQALERARRERLVDDPAMVAALVEERRAKGHAPARIRRDLRERGFGNDLLDPALASAESQDQEAAAFAIAVDKAAGLTGVPTDTAFRRVAGFVARRGYPDGLARKVAREAVFASRDAERAAGH